MTDFLSINDIDCDVEELLYSDSEMPMARTFILNSGSSIVGLIIEESEDAYIVALPCKLVSDSSDRSDMIIAPYVPCPYIKLAKSHAGVVCPCFGEFERYYLKYVVDNAEEILPGLINEDTKEYMLSRSEAAISVLRPEKEEVVEVDKDVKVH